MRAQLAHQSARGCGGGAGARAGRDGGLGQGQNAHQEDQQKTKLRDYTAAEKAAATPP